MKFSELDKEKTYIDCEGFTWNFSDGKWKSFCYSIDSTKEYKDINDREFGDPLTMPIKTRENKASDTQVSGSHYKDYAIQPYLFFHKNKVPHGEACAIKYLLRHRDKNGVKDLDKAIHYIQMIKEYEYEG